MQTLGWERVFRAVPAEFLNKLCITTAAGVEIAVQCLLRIEPECVVVRGRLAGSQDTGRVFFIAYAQIDNVGFLCEMRESEFHEHFAGLQFPERISEPVPSVPESVPEPVSVPVEEVEVPPALLEEVGLTPIAPSTVPPSRAELPIKSEVLERFRNRGTQSPGTPRPGKPSES